MTEKSPVLRVPLGPPPRQMKYAAYVLAGVAAAWAVANVAVAVSWAPLLGRHPELLFGPWLPWVPFAACSGLIWYLSLKRKFLEFTADGVTLTGIMPLVVIHWRDAGRLFAVRAYRETRANPFPVLVVLESSKVGMIAGHSGPPDFVGLQPGRLDTTDLERTALARFIEGCPPAVVDPEVLLVYALTMRATNARDTAANNPVPLDSADAVVADLLADPSGHESLTAPFEYFLGHVGKAKTQSEAGLMIEPGAWDLLLCRALCERSLGDDKAWRSSLRAALQVPPPPEIAAVLAHALEVA